MVKDSKTHYNNYLASTLSIWRFQYSYFISIVIYFAPILVCTCRSLIITKFFWSISSQYYSYLF